MYSDHQVPAEEDAVLVAMVKKEGGIPFTKTNVPQTLLSFECGNALFGTTTNPSVLILPSRLKDSNLSA